MKRKKKNNQPFLQCKNNNKSCDVDELVVEMYNKYGVKNQKMKTTNKI